MTHDRTCRSAVHAKPFNPPVIANRIISQLDCSQALGIKGHRLGVNESGGDACVLYRNQAGVLRAGYRCGLRRHGDLARRRRRTFRSKRDRNPQDESVGRRLHGGVWARVSPLPDPPGKGESIHAGGTCCRADLLSPHSKVDARIMQDEVSSTLITETQCQFLM